MLLRKILPAIPAVFTIVALSGCAAQDEAAVGEAGDPPEVTCERFHDTIEQFSDIDPDTMGFGDILAHVSEGFAEIEAIADEAQDDELAQSIDTMSETLNSSIAASGGDIDAVGAEFQERLQDPDVNQAAAYLEEACGTGISL